MGSASGEMIYPELVLLCSGLFGGVNGWYVFSGYVVIFREEFSRLVVPMICCLSNVPGLGW